MKTKPRPGARAPQQLTDADLRVIAGGSKARSGASGSTTVKYLTIKLEDLVISKVDFSS